MRLETDESGTTVTSVVVDRNGVPERYRADIVVVSAGAVNSAALLLRSANEHHPEGLGNSSGRRRPPLHVAHQLGARRGLQGPEPDALPEDARPQRLLLRLGRLRVPARAHPDARQVRPRGDQGRRAGAHARLRARLHRQSRRRLLAHLRGSPRSRQPRHRRPQRAHPRGLHRHQLRGPPAPDRQAQGPAHAASAATRG